MNLFRKRKRGNLWDVKGRSITGARSLKNERHNGTGESLPMHRGERKNLEVGLERPFVTWNESEENKRVEVAGHGLFSSFNELGSFGESSSDSLGGKRVPVTILKMANIAGDDGEGSMFKQVRRDAESQTPFLDGIENNDSSVVGSDNVSAHGFVERGRSCGFSMVCDKGSLLEVSGNVEGVLASGRIGESKEIETTIEEREVMIRGGSVISRIGERGKI